MIQVNFDEDWNKPPPFFDSKHTELQSKKFRTEERGFNLGVSVALCARSLGSLKRRSQSNVSPGGAEHKRFLLDG